MPAPVHLGATSHPPSSGGGTAGVGARRRGAGVQEVLEVRCRCGGGAGGLGGGAGASPSVTGKCLGHLCHYTTAVY